jgi:ribonuclease BN (tRNA processing enzyme)
MEEMEVTFIGTVGSALTADQTYSSILIDENLLLDCGEGTTQKLIKLNMINKIEIICITHLHNDHIMGIFSLLWYYWIASQRTRPIKIIGPPKLEYTIKKILDLINTPKNAFKFEINMQEMEDSEEIQIVNRNTVNRSNYKISTIKAEHKPISFAYRIEKTESGNSIVYTGDTRPVNRLIELDGYHLYIL